jgi:hypothetical protein
MNSATHHEQRNAHPISLLVRFSARLKVRHRSLIYWPQNNIRIIRRR